MKVISYSLLFVQLLLLVLLLLVSSNNNNKNFVTCFTEGMSAVNDQAEDSRQLYGFGSNRYGQLGLFDSTTMTKVPTSNNFLNPSAKVLKICVVNHATTDFESIYGEDASSFEPYAYHGIIVDSDLNVYSWGYGSPGQGSTERLDATQNYKNLTMLFNINTLLGTGANEGNVLSLACGSTHTIMITQPNKRVIVFGNHGQGQLGIGNVDTDKAVIPPMRATALESYGFNKVWIIGTSTVAATNDKTYGFGENSFSQLCFLDPLAESTSVYSPVELFQTFAAGDRLVQDVSGGIQFMLMLMANGSMFGCGNDRGGFVLGLGKTSTDIYSTPQLVNIASKITHVSTSGSTTIVVDENKKLFGWGENKNEQLCVPDSEIHTAVTIPLSLGSGESIQSVHLSLNSLMVHIKGSSDRIVVCGNNTFSNMGVLNSTTGYPPEYSSGWLPVDLSELGSAAVDSLAVLDSNVFTLANDGALFVHGDLSRTPNVPVYYSSPTPINAYSEDEPTTALSFEKIAAGDQVSTAFTTKDGRVFVWGAQLFPRNFLTNGMSKFSVYQPFEFPPLKGKNISQIVLGIASDSSTTLSTIVKYVFSPMTFYALKNDTKTLYAWGSNELGQLAIGLPENSTPNITIPDYSRTPVTPMFKVGEKVGKLVSSGRHQFALTEYDNDPLPSDPTNPFPAREIWKQEVWGDAKIGQLGINLDAQGTPLLVESELKIRDVAVSDFHSIRVLKDYTVWGVGDGADGRIGTYSGNIWKSINIPAQIEKVFAGTKCSFFISKDNGTVYVTGSNQYGQLGLPQTITEVDTPVELTAVGDGIINIATASGGGAHTLFLNSKGEVFVTGRNDKGQLGLGHFQNVYIPEKLSFSAGKVALEIAAGVDHSLVLVGSRSCPSNCNGRGYCDPVRGKCSCYSTAAGTAKRNFIGYDCSLLGCTDPLCSGHGTCNLARGRCVCNTGFTGLICQSRKCPNNCLGRGTCTGESGKCFCDPGYSGTDCSIGGAYHVRAGITVLIVTLLATLLSCL